MLLKILSFFVVYGVVQGAPKLREPAFFAQAIRRDPIAIEKKRFVQLKTHYDESAVENCTAFPVANRGGHFYFASARHCASYAFTSLCREQKIELTTLAHGYRGICIQTIFDPEDHDFVIFEAQFPSVPANSIREELLPARLSGRWMFEDPLVMYGFPSDPERNRQATTTNNCWVLDPAKTRGRDVQFLDSKERSEITRFFQDRDDTKDAYLRGIFQRAAALSQFLTDTYGEYNCSVYSGNSGGPIFKERTDEVIGLPAKYLPNVYRYFPQTLYTTFVSLSPILLQYHEVFETLGIITVL